MELAATVDEVALFVERLAAPAIEALVGDLPDVGHALELRGLPVDVGTRVHSRFFGGFFVLRRVLVRAGEEKDFVATLATKSREDVCRRPFIGMVESWRSIDVIDRGRDVELSARHLGILGRT